MQGGWRLRVVLIGLRGHRGRDARCAAPPSPCLVGAPSTTIAIVQVGPSALCAGVRTGCGWATHRGRARGFATVAARTKDSSWKRSCMLGERFRWVRLRATIWLGHGKLWGSVGNVWVRPVGAPSTREDCGPHDAVAGPRPCCPHLQPQVEGKVVSLRSATCLLVAGVDTLGGREGEP